MNAHERVGVLLAIGVLAAIAGNGTSGEKETGMGGQRLRNIETKKSRLLRHLATYDPFDYGDPKHGFPVCIARLWKDPNDERSFDYVRQKVSQGSMFGKYTLCRLYFQYKDVLPDDVKQAIKDHVTSYGAWFAGGTENHINMWRTSAYLFAEEWPDAQWAGGMTGREVKRRCLEYFHEYGRKVYTVGMGEWDSPVYMIFHVLTFQNVRDFARGEEARAIAEAMLDYYLADWALDYYHGFYGGAHKREYFQKRHHRQPTSSESDYLSWLYWGENVELDFSAVEPDPTRDRHIIYTSLAAVSDYVPKAPINNVARKRVALPCMSYESKPTYHMTGRREDCKSTYVTEDYILGGAYIGTVLEWGWANNQIKAWSLGFRSDKELVEITSNHPFYVTEREAGEANYQGYSPYQRLMHYRDALLVLYRIPKEEPYRFANVRIPAGLDEREVDGRWVFLREGDAYAAIRALGTDEPKMLTEGDGWDRIKAPGENVGFIVQAGQKADYPTLADFRAAMENAGESIGYNGSVVEYTTLAGDELKMQYFPPRSKPLAWVNGRQLDFDAWALFDSPYVWSDVGSGVLNVTDGQAGFTIDWSGEVPEWSDLDRTHEPTLPVQE